MNSGPQTGWSLGKVEKVQRLLPRILETVAEALDVPPAEVWDIWASGAKPEMAPPPRQTRTIDAVVRSVPGTALVVGGAPVRAYGKWTPELQDELRRLAGTMPVKQLVAHFQASRASLFAEAARLDISLAFFRRSPQQNIETPAEIGAAAMLPASRFAEHSPPAEKQFSALPTEVRAPAEPAAPPDAVVQTVEPPIGADDLRLVDRRGRYLKRDGEGFTRNAREAWSGSAERAAVLQRRNPHLRRLTPVAA